MSTTQRVTPLPNGKWQHKADGNQRATRIADTQNEAIESATRVAKNQGGELIVHDQHGQIRMKNTYSKKDPFPPKG